MCTWSLSLIFDISSLIVSHYVHTHILLFCLTSLCLFNYSLFIIQYFPLLFFIHTDIHMVTCSLITSYIFYFFLLVYTYNSFFYICIENCMILVPLLYIYLILPNAFIILSWSFFFHFFPVSSFSFMSFSLFSLPVSPYTYPGDTSCSIPMGVLSQCVCMLRRFCGALVDTDISNPLCGLTFGCRTYGGHVFGGLLLLCLVYILSDYVFGHFWPAALAFSIRSCFYVTLLRASLPLYL